MDEQVQEPLQTSHHIPSQDEIDAVSNWQEKFQLLRPETCYELNERDFSRLFSQVTHLNLVYCATNGKWYYYNGKYWVQDENSVFSAQQMKIFSFELKKYAVSIAETQEDGFLTYVEKLGSVSKRKSLLLDAQTNNVIFQEDFDKDPYLLNLQNGTYSLDSGQFMPHNPAHYITKICYADYDHNVNTDEIDNFMLDIFQNDHDLVRYVYRILGYSLSGLNNEECMFAFYGPLTRNGKSTLLNLFSYLLGDETGYAKNIDVSTLAKRTKLNGSYASSDVARMQGSRFVIASEPPGDMQLDESRIKSMTGGDFITARYLHQNDFQFKAQFKIFIGCNTLPSVDDTIIQSNRIRVVPFNRYFGPDEQDKGLKERLRKPETISAFLKRCIQGFQDFMRLGCLAEPKAVLDATANYNSTGKIMRTFIESELIAEPAAFLPLSKFYPFYQNWCINNGFIPMTREKVNNYLKRNNLYRPTATVNGRTVRNIVCGYRIPDDTNNVGGNI